MTYSDAIARGRGTVEYLLRLDGIPYLFATRSGFPDLVQLTQYEDTVVGLEREGIEYSCHARPLDVIPETSEWTATVRTDDSRVLDLLRPVEAGRVVRLTTSMTATAATITVASTTGWPASGVLYVDGEACSYTGTTATTFTGVTRGIYGSIATTHDVDLDIYPPCEPEVTDRPGTLLMRRAVLYAAEYRDDVPSAVERVWVGYVSGPHRTAPGEVRIPLAPTIHGLATGTIYGAAGSGRLNGIYLPLTAARHWRTLRIWMPAVPATWTATIPAGWYAGADELIAAAEAAVAALGASYTVERATSGHVRIHYHGAGAGGRYCSGGLAWLLGYDSNEDGLWQLYHLVGDETEEAPSPCAEVFARLAEAGAREEQRLYLHAGEAARFVESAVTLVDPADPESTYGWWPVAEVNTTDDYLRLGAMAALRGDAWPEVFVARGDAPAAIVRQVWHATGGVRGVLASTLGVSLVGYPVVAPRTWLPLPGLDGTPSSDPEVGDVDWLELGEALDGAPSEVGVVELVLSEPRDGAEVLRGLLLPCGVYCYQQRQGKVGFRRARVPSAGEAGESVGAAVLDADALPQAESTIGAERPVTVLHFTVPDGSRHADALKSGVFLTDLRALQRYGARLQRDTSDALGYLSDQALAVECYALIGEEPTAWLRAAGSWLGSTLFAWLRRPRVRVQFVVTPGARTHEIGDVVEVTAWSVYDHAEGSLGLTGKRALVTGWREHHGAGAATDDLEVTLIDEVGGVIAPAALATAWQAGTLTFTFADDTLFKRASDASDLAHFAAGMEIVVRAYDRDTPTTLGPFGVVSVDVTAKEMVLDENPFPAEYTPSHLILYADYDDAVASQTGGEWVWYADETTGVIGLALVAGREWT